MKRIVYISRLSPNTLQKEIQKIAEVSSQNNKKIQITGILLCLGDFFFQVIEGEIEQVELLYRKILADTRHTDILCLKTEYDVTERLYPNWAMKTINLDEMTDVIIQPIKSLLKTVTESHRILEKYTQPSVINILTQGRNPLQVLPQLTEKIIFFSDICSFSIFAEKLPVIQVVSFVNQYLEICSKHISAFGGEVSKFIGDSVMASFPNEAGDAAIESCLVILNELQQLREQTSETMPLHFLYTGIGLSCGKVIEGNIGSHCIKMDYTLLGDEVNTAARLEGLTRHLSYMLAFTETVKMQTKKNWPFINLGTHQVKGKQKSINIFSIDKPITRKKIDTPQLAQLISYRLDSKINENNGEIV